MGFKDQLLAFVTCLLLYLLSLAVSLVLDALHIVNGVHVDYLVSGVLIILLTQILLITASRLKIQYSRVYWTTLLQSSTAVASVLITGFIVSYFKLSDPIPLLNALYYPSVLILVFVSILFLHMALALLWRIPAIRRTTF